MSTTKQILKECADARAAEKIVAEFTGEDFSRAVGDRMSHHEIMFYLSMGGKEKLRRAMIDGARAAAEEAAKAFTYVHENGLDEPDMREWRIENGFEQPRP